MRTQTLAMNSVVGTKKTLYKLNVWITWHKNTQSLAHCHADTHIHSWRLFPAAVFLFQEACAHPLLPSCPGSTCVAHVFNFSSLCTHILCYPLSSPSFISSSHPSPAQHPLGNTSLLLPFYLPPPFILNVHQINLMMVSSIRTPCNITCI